jgi:hypothetical protein
MIVMDFIVNSFPSLDNDRLKHQRLYQVVISILNYLLDHPNAKDTLEGVAKWWVGEDEELAKEALIFLQKEEVVEKRGQLYQLKQFGEGGADTACLEK